MANAFGPASGTASPSASVARVSQRTDLPALSASWKQKPAAPSATHAINLRRRPECFHGQRKTGEQSAPTHRDHDRVKIADLLDDFHADRPLPGDDVGRVVTVDVGEALRSREGVGAITSRREVTAVPESPAHRVCGRCLP